MVFDAGNFVALVDYWAAQMEQNRERLIQLDSIVGDSDLGLTMSDGFRAAYARIADTEEKDLGKLSYTAGKAMAIAVPSSMGTLMASGFMEAGKALKGKTTLDAQGVYTFFDAFYRGVQNRGGAKPGEKTFLDGWTGSLALLEAGRTDGSDLALTASRLPEVAHRDLLATNDMLAKHGRAAARGEQSRNMLDPGAAVAELMIIGYTSYIKVLRSDVLSA